MRIRKATLDDMLTTSKIVEKQVLQNLTVIGLTEPYLSYLCTDNYRNQIKGLFLNAHETIKRDNDIVYVVTDDLDKIVGYVSGGFSLDNEDYDGEIYTLFTTASDMDLKIRTELFNAIIIQLKSISCQSVHVEIRTDDVNKDFYMDKGAQFITGIKNMANPPYTTLDFGWTDIDKIKLS